MLWTIINEADVYYSFDATCVSGAARSSNPYTYIRSGYHLDNASLFGGTDNVAFNGDFSGNRAGTDLGAAGVGKRSFNNIS